MRICLTRFVPNEIPHGKSDGIGLIKQDHVEEGIFRRWVLQEAIVEGGNEKFVRILNQVQQLSLRIVGKGLSLCISDGAGLKTLLLVFSQKHPSGLAVVDTPEPDGAIHGAVHVGGPHHGQMAMRGNRACELALKGEIDLIFFRQVIEHGGPDTPLRALCRPVQLIAVPIQRRNLACILPWGEHGNILLSFSPVEDVFKIQTNPIQSVNGQVWPGFPRQRSKTASLILLITDVVMKAASKTRAIQPQSVLSRRQG